MLPQKIVVIILKKIILNYSFEFTPAVIFAGGALFNTPNHLPYKFRTLFFL